MNTSATKRIILSGVVGLGMAYAVVSSGYGYALKASLTNPMPSTSQTESDFWYTFNVDEALDESEQPSTSDSIYWWLDSGGRLVIADGIGMTVQGTLPSGDKWQTAYGLTNPTDTDLGHRPQNVFRLLTQRPWLNVTQQVYMRVTRDNKSASPAKNESNGLLLFSRYQDEDNLYYAGLRVDGTAVIKKKREGTYYALATASYQFSSGSKLSAHNVIPGNIWIGIGTHIRTLANGQVKITLSIDQGGPGGWKEVLTATDDGKKYDGPPIMSPGRAGIRTDFMDVQFRNYHAYGH